MIKKSLTIRILESIIKHIYGITLTILTISLVANLALFILFKLRNVEIRELNDELSATKSNLQNLNEDIDYLKSSFRRDFFPEIKKSYNDKNWEQTIKVCKEYLQYIEDAGQEVVPNVYLYQSYSYYSLTKDKGDSDKRKEFLEKAKKSIENFHKYYKTSTSMLIEALILLEDDSITSYENAISILIEAQSKSKETKEIINIKYHIAYSYYKIAEIEHKKKSANFEQVNENLMKAEEYLSRTSHKSKNKLLRSIDRLKEEIK